MSLLLLIFSSFLTLHYTLETYPIGSYIVVDFETNIRWTNANSHCVSNYGTTLISIKSTEEENAVEDAMTQSGLASSPVWIGGEDPNNDNTYTWTEDGSTMSYNNWDPQDCSSYTEPSSFGGCVLKYAISGGFDDCGTWVVDFCTSTFSTSVFICYAPTNHPTTTPITMAPSIYTTRNPTITGYLPIWYKASDSTSWILNGIDATKISNSGDYATIYLDPSFVCKSPATYFRYTVEFICTEKGTLCRGYVGIGDMNCVSQLSDSLEDFAGSPDNGWAIFCTNRGYGFYSRGKYANSTHNPDYGQDWDTENVFYNITTVVDFISGSIEFFRNDVSQGIAQSGIDFSTSTFSNGIVALVSMDSTDRGNVTLLEWVCTYPTNEPTGNPSSHPTNDGSLSSDPSEYPSMNPSSHPTNNPSVFPSQIPSLNPSIVPTVNPTNYPTISPSTSRNPSNAPTSDEIPATNPLTFNPTHMKTNNPSHSPQISPTGFPTINPTIQPTNSPIPTANPTNYPSNSPVITNHSSNNPTNNPITTNNPTKQPTNTPIISSSKKDKNSSFLSSELSYILLGALAIVLIVVLCFIFYFIKRSKNKKSKTNGKNIKMEIELNEKLKQMKPQNHPQLFSVKSTSAVDTPGNDTPIGLTRLTNIVTSGNDNTKPGESAESSQNSYLDYLEEENEAKDNITTHINITPGGELDTNSKTNGIKHQIVKDDNIEDEGENMNEINETIRENKRVKSKKELKLHMEKKDEIFGQVLQDGNMVEDIVFDDIIEEMDDKKNGVINEGINTGGNKNEKVYVTPN